MKAVDQEKPFLLMNLIEDPVIDRLGYWLQEEVFRDRNFLRAALEDLAWDLYPISDQLMQLPYGYSKSFTEEEALAEKLLRLDLLGRNGNRYFASLEFGSQCKELMQEAGRRFRLYPVINSDLLGTMVALARQGPVDGTAEEIELRHFKWADGHLANYLAYCTRLPPREVICLRYHEAGSALVLDAGGLPFKRGGAGQLTGGVRFHRHAPLQYVKNGEQVLEWFGASMCNCAGFRRIYSRFGINMEPAGLSRGSERGLLSH